MFLGPLSGEDSELDLDFDLLAGRMYFDVPPGDASRLSLGLETVSWFEDLGSTLDNLDFSSRSDEESDPLLLFIDFVLRSRADERLDPGSSPLMSCSDWTLNSVLFDNALALYLRSVDESDRFLLCDEDEPSLLSDEERDLFLSKLRFDLFLSLDFGLDSRSEEEDPDLYL